MNRRLRSPKRHLGLVNPTYPSNLIRSWSRNHRLVIERLQREESDLTDSERVNKGMGRQVQLKRG
jgi:hypothetical protein